jgi:hypothetical protein
MGRRYANILQTVGDTPVVQISRLAPPDVNLYVKIEAFNPLGSVKDRLAIRASSTRSCVSPAPMHCVAAATWHKRKAFSLAYPPERPLLARCKSAPGRQMAPRSSACCPTLANAI